MEDKIAVVLTALSLEFKAARAHLTNVRMVEHPNGTIYELGKFSSGGPDWTVAVVQTGQGNVRAAIEAERAIARFNPSHVFFVGIAGGIKDVMLGDVVAGSKVYGYESGKAAEEFRTRTDIGESSYDLVQRAAMVARNDKWQHRILGSKHTDAHAIVAPIAAGEKVISSTSSSTFALLTKHFSDAVAVEMEGLGVLRAGYANPRVRLLVVRGISDLINDKAVSDSHGWQETASTHAAAFAFEVLAGVSIDHAGDLSPTAGIAISDSSEWWDKTERLAIELYPKGPEDGHIWSRAGGDIALIDLSLIGKASWHSALRKLRLGGGGREISAASLLAEMKEDFPNNTALRTLTTISIASSKPNRGADLVHLEEGIGRESFSDSQVLRPKVAQRVFVSYSRTDRQWLDDLLITLKPYLKEEVFEVWDDSRIGVGSLWEQEIGQALANAQVAVLLVSRHFFGSDFIAKKELPFVLAAAQRGDLKILWIAVTASPVDDSPLGRYQAANDPRRPLNSLSKSELDVELVKIARQIKAAMELEGTQ